jgi:erythronate-4-phosphate dehydrogenase
MLKNADVLVVRSVTQINSALLDGTNVRFVGSATAGTDHVDTDYLGGRKITFRYAPGSNAESVAEYITSALVRLSAITDFSLTGKSIGIVGYGHTGTRVARRARGLGLEVVASDPPLADLGTEGLASFSDILDCDILSFHVPLTLVSKYPTYHLLDRQALSRTRKTTWVLNASRGAVVDGEALLDMLRSQDRSLLNTPRVVLDVWEGEPSPDPELIQAVDLATPHIAGYSFDGKLSGSTMIATALHDWLESGASFDASPVNQPSPAEAPFDAKDTRLIHPQRSTYESQEHLLDDLATQMYDVSIDDDAMRLLSNLNGTERAKGFIALRKEYRQRRTFRAFSVRRSELPIDAFPGIEVVVEQALRCLLV